MSKDSSEYESTIKQMGRASTEQRLGLSGSPTTSLLLQNIFKGGCLALADK